MNLNLRAASYESFNVAVAKLSYCTNSSLNLQFYSYNGLLLSHRLSTSKLSDL